MKKAIWAICLFSLIFACKENTQKEPKKFTISGELSDFPEDTKLYLQASATEAVFDSTTIRNKKFRFEGEITDPPDQIHLVGTVNDRLFYTYLLIGNEDLHIKGYLDDFPNDLKITGSKTQDQVNFLAHKVKKNRAKRDSIFNLVMQAFQAGNKEKANKINEQVTKIDSTVQHKKLNYIKSHPQSYTSAIELNFLRGVLSKQQLRKIYKGFDPKIKESKYGKVLKIYLNEKILAVGDHFQDFEGIDPNEKKIKLSEIRGPYTLLDFTSAYCGPCIQSISELKEIKKTYSDSLKIVSVSQNINKETWLKSLKRDQITWTSMWDGEGIYGKMAIQYGVEGFPTFVLINPAGNIIDKWSGYGKGGLIKRLKPYLAPD